MKQYLLSVYQPAGELPDPEFLAGVMRDVEELNQRLRAAGAWVFAGGLHAPDSATVVRADGDDVLTTDGPFVEAKEYLGGVTIIRAEDLASALAWGRRLAAATTLPIEVRPFQDGD
ncbi:YciI family protein [Prauserella cavernicola]|uniref:YCII-related domain-containing protein n=1 Tax=Prauserella cavernicola TaxID=2800127 RepID=A0A934QNA1_9PSEU|nr:YciI family protein [Prauserella cavernicola]MBK1782971.1 hypothetical protein [Prauserella cavernicola]